jgi:hypothetical protein
VYPLVLLLIMALWLPKSPRFLVAPVNLGPRDRTLLARLGITPGRAGSTARTSLVKTR